MREKIKKNNDKGSGGCTGAINSVRRLFRADEKERARNNRSFQHIL